MAAFRDSQIVVVDVDRHSIRAGVGLHELLNQPSVGIEARVGLRPDINISNGQAEGHKEMDVDGPIRTPRKTKPSQYLVGQTLEEAIAAGDDVEIYWPFEGGKISDWSQAEALWRHVLFQRLGLRRIQNESPVLLLVPSGMSRREHELLTRIFFERLNVAAFSILERPLAQLYAANSISGVVVDIGRNVTEITPIVDSMVGLSARMVIPVGIRDCEIHLVRVLKSNQSVLNAISSFSEDEQKQSLNEIVRQIWTQGHVKIPLQGEQSLEEEDGITDLAAVLVAGKEKVIIESNMKKKATAKANAAERERAREIEAMDIIQVNWKGHNLTLGKDRHRFCEPLFDARFCSQGYEGNPAIALPLQEALHHVIREVDIDYRIKVLDGLFVTGEITGPVKGIGAALQSHLTPYVLSNGDIMSDVQPKGAKVLKVPDYFANFRDRDNLASFLGACIVAKTLFSDPGSQTFASKSEYSKVGPRAILDFVPTMI